MKVGLVSNTEWCIPLLQYLRSANVEPVLYIGAYNDATNISTLISFCDTNNIAVEKEDDPVQLFSWLQMQQPDYCFVYGYKKLIDVKRLEGFQKKLFNIHPGSLPEYRGASPIFWQIKNGETTLGLTIHFINERYDAGEIVWSKEINNEAHFSFGMMEYIFSNLLIEGVNHVLSHSIDSLPTKGVKQNENKAVTYKKPTLKDVLINWKTMQANEVVNLVRACNPWNKGAIAVYNGMEVKVIDAEVSDDETEKMPGTIIEVGEGIKVVCKGNSVVKINIMNMNGIFVPCRFARSFGFVQGQSFVTSI